MASRLQRALARFPTYRTYIRERPDWLWVLVCGRMLALRKLERRFNHARVRPLGSIVGTRLRVQMPDRIIPELIHDGASTRFWLTPEDVETIRAFAIETPCATRADPATTFLAIDVSELNRGRPHDILTAYFFEKVEQCPLIGILQDDPLLRGVARAYLGSDPRHIRTRLWWSFPAQRVRDADLHAAAQGKYHFDLNGFRTLKFFFYLSDTDLRSGAHGYIAGTHRTRRLRHQLTFMVGHDEGRLRECYGSDSFRIIEGPAGTGFVEDPFLFPIGHRCEDRARLLLEIEFGSTEASPSYRYGVLG